MSVRKIILRKNEILIGLVEYSIYRGIIIK